MTMKVDFRSRGSPAEKRNLWQFNEWAFTVTLFMISLSIVLIKLAMYCGPNSNPTIYSGLSNRNFHFDASNFLKSTMNASIHFEELVSNKTVNFFKDYYWFLRALICGLAVTLYTWFIIYKDSQVPGINPPSPFSYRKKSYYRSNAVSCMHMNYLMGLIIGVLIFIYMCF